MNESGGKKKEKVDRYIMGQVDLDRWWDMKLPHQQVAEPLFRSAAAAITHQPVRRFPHLTHLQISTKYRWTYFKTPTADQNQDSFDFQISNS